MNYDFINQRLKSIIRKDKMIYVLKGFNTIYDHIEVLCDHIFRTNIENGYDNLEKIDRASFTTENFAKLAKGGVFFCFFEEMLFSQELIGMVSSLGYKIEIVDIGCFDYYYPGFLSFGKREVQELFDKDEENKDSNIIQKLYSNFSIKNGNPIIAYNIIEDIDNGTFSEVKLLDHYSGDFDHYKFDAEIKYEITDNSSHEIFIQMFNQVVNNEVNTIDYIRYEGKDDLAINKMLFFINKIGANIIIKNEQKNYDRPDNYEDYLKILRRKNKDWDFKDICIYEDPFNSDRKRMINQSVIIDKIYQNILKAKDGKNPKDIFVTAPTGAGKSILFQIPAIMAAEKDNLVTIVVSPLIGLMKDQVNNIKALTFAAETINSEYTPYQKEQIKEKIKNGTCSILYVSPETLLSNNDITTFIGDRKIGLLVVDEAHTVATWGKNFRPDYWYLGDYIDKLRHSMSYIFPIATFTATATISNGHDDMYHDIIESLNMTCDPFFGNVKRDDIKFNINLCKVDHAYQEEKEVKAKKRIEEFIKSGEKTLVYFPYVRILDEMYSQLPSDKVGKYHGRLDKIDKDETLEDIRFGNKKVVLATKAFGMGIDVKDIKNVYHFAPTGNLADYVQEIGRAARDPKIEGVASTDYFENDFRYINQLYGLSEIKNFHVIEVLKKIDHKYKKEKKRNFMVSTEDFAYIFSDDKEDDIESKLKATIIAIKKDFKSRSKYVPLIFKPRSMFTDGLFFIPDAKMPLVKAYGWSRYLEKKFDREELNKMASDTEKHIYMGDVYWFKFKKCWEDNYNGKYDGKTFGQFKRDFYNGELPGIDRSCFIDKMILNVEPKHGDTFGWVIHKSIEALDDLKETLDNLKITNKHYTAYEIAEEFCKANSGKYNITKIRNSMDAILNILDAYKRGYKGFLEYNSKTNKYHICSADYDRTRSQIKQSILSHFSDYKDSKDKRVIIVDGVKNDNKMRNDTILVAVQLLELLDLATYTFESGRRPEFFVRVNSEKAILKVIEDKDYRSETLDSIKRLHLDSVRYMKYFFETLQTDEERWQFIEDYFLGRVEEKYVIDKGKNYVFEDEARPKKLINVYTVYHSEDDITVRYYVSDTNIKFLDERKCSRISPGCEVAKQLAKNGTGQVFSINEYEYLVEKIEKYDNQID